MVRFNEEYSDFFSLIRSTSRLDEMLDTKVGWLNQLKSTLNREFGDDNLNAEIDSNKRELTMSISLFVKLKIKPPLTLFTYYVNYAIHR